MAQANSNTKQVYAEREWWKAWILELGEQEATIQFKASNIRVKVPLDDTSRLRPLQESWDDVSEEDAIPVVDGIVVDGVCHVCMYVFMYATISETIFSNEDAIPVVDDIVVDGMYVWCSVCICMYAYMHM